MFIMFSASMRSVTRLGGIWQTLIETTSLHPLYHMYLPRSVEVEGNVLQKAVMSSGGGGCVGKMLLQTFSWISGSETIWHITRASE